MPNQGIVTIMQDTEKEALISLFQDGRHDLLELHALELLNKDPRQGLVWKLYGASLAQKGAWQEALTAMSRACDLLPEDAEGFANLGLALFHAGRPAEAVEACQKALRLDPQTGSAWSNLGIILRHQGRFQEALQYQLKAAALSPGSAEVQGNLGIVCKELGLFEESINHFRRALILQFTQLKALPQATLRSLKPGPGRPVMPRAEAYRALDALRERLDAAGIPWCLVAGTVLGIHRDGDLLPNDKDLDVGVPEHVERARLGAALGAGSPFVLVEQLAVPVAARNRYSMSFVHLETGVTIDVFFMHPEGEAQCLMGMDHPGLPMLARIRRFSIAELSWRGRSWPVPYPLPQYLEDIYGTGWVRPDPGFDTVLSNPNRTVESLPATLCYGYSCLNSRLLEHNWTKSLAYCRQLLLRLPDPLLRDLGAWLGQVEEAR